jgi:NitT/TauT family transport system substrate-binding protein
MDRGAGRLSRRQFVQDAAGLGLATTGLALLGACGREDRPSAVTEADAPLETTTIKLARTPTLCTNAPAYVAAALLEVEGFQTVEYTAAPLTPGDFSAATADATITYGYAPYLIARVDAGAPLVVIGGLHSGCLELIGTEQIRTVTDLKGKRVAVSALPSPAHVFLSTMLAYVGLDPSRDVTWVAQPRAESIALLAAGQVDAYMESPPAAQELRARQIGHVVLSTTADRPWSEHYCCMIAANRDFVRRYPVATKRALRALLKAAELCAREPERAVETAAAHGFGSSNDYTLQGIREIPYADWREYDAADTFRFFALRLHEAKMIQTSPERLLAQGADFRFQDELKRELKG